MTTSNRTRCTAALELIAAVLLMAMPLSAADAPARTVVAVVPFQLIMTDGKAAPQSDGVTRGLEDALLASLSENPRVSLVERAELEKGFRERNMTAAGLTETCAAANAGSALKADVVVLGRVRALGKEFNAVVRVVSCNGGEVLGASEIQGDPAALARQAGSMAGDIADAIAKLKIDTQTLAIDNTKQAPLEAIKHHERALAMKGAKAFEVAACEELLALRSDSSVPGADAGFLDALAKAGFSDLAKAEAQSRIQTNKDNATTALLRELANAPDAPKPVSAPVVEALKIDAGKRLAEWFDQQAQNGNVDTLHDACMAWMNLGDQYASEGRDSSAIQAYAQGMTRVRKLRALDPGTLGDWSFNFRNSNLPPAERLLETLIHARYDRPLYVPTTEEAALWDEVLRDPILPDGAVASLPVYEFQVPIIDQVVIQRARSTGGGQDPYLFQIDWKQLASGMIVLRASVRDKQSYYYTLKEVQLIQQHWIGAEATVLHARKNVPWFAANVSDTLTLSGRLIQSAAMMSLPEAISVSMAQQNPAAGFLVYQFPWPSNLTKDPEKTNVALQISAVFPPGKQPPNAATDSISHLEAGLLAFLKRDKATAAREWGTARDMSLTATNPGYDHELVFWESLNAACEGPKK